jgi:hypothetical protein
MKLAKETSHKPLAESRSAFNTILLTGLMASGLLVGCSSVGQKTDESSEPVTSSTTAPNNSTVKADTKKTIEQKQDSAAALMATLSAPIQEPMAQKSMAREPTAQQAVTMNPKPDVEVKTLAVKAVEAKVAEVKKEVVPMVEVKPVEKMIAKAPIETVKVAPKPMIKKIVSAKKKKNAKPLKISVKDLPVTYDIWQLKQGVAALEKGIVVSTPTWEMGKESYNSQIWVTIMENQILINSSSDINTSAGNLGIKINDGSLIPFTRIEANNIGVIEGQWLDQLEEGGNMDIFLGFFPGKIPKSDVFKTDVSLDSLSRVVPTYRNLLK